MSRYVDIDELIVIGLDDPDCEHQFKFVPWEFIEDAPTADVVEVVRCKECKYVSTDATCYHVCCRDGMGLKPYHVYHDDYCSYGERREDDEG